MYNVIGSGTAAWIACLYLLKANKKVTLFRDPNTIVRKIVNQLFLQLMKSN